MINTKAINKKMPKGRKEEIIEKAVQLFLKKGYDRATLRDLGKAVGIEAPGVYYYFKSKKDLLNQIDQNSWKRFQEMVLDQAKAAADPEERIRLYVNNMIKYQLVMAEKNVMIDNSVSAKAIRGRKGRDREVFEFLRGTLGELAARRGIENSVNPTLGAFSLFAMVSHIHHWYKPNGKLTIENLSKEIVHLFLFGFCSEYQNLVKECNLTSSSQIRRK